MNEKVTVDANLQAKLAAGPPVGLCDADGKVIGVAVTVDEFQRYLRAWAVASVTKEELDRLSASTTWYTMDDVLRLVEGA